MISLTGIKKHYSSQVIFNNLNISFYDDDRVALIGRNGTGKTTLLRLIVGKEEANSGTVAVTSGTTVGYLAQEVETVRDASPLEIVLEPFSHLLDYEEVYEAASKSASLGDHRHVKKALEKIDALQAQMDFVDAFSLASRAKSILAGLGVPDDKWESPVQELSGGYRMRVMLARLLLLSPSMLLLDEPTNHLDMDSLVWLETFLRRYRGGLIVVSHDRDFLNRATGITAELSAGGMTVYKGNYDAYMMYKEERDRSDESTRANLERQIAQKERFIERFRAKATKASQVQSRIRFVEDLKEQLPEVPRVQKTIRFRFPSPSQSGGVPFKLENISVSYGDAAVFNKVNLTVTRGDKIAVVGPNGAGKTTLLKLLAGGLKPQEGRLTVGHNVDLRYFGQHQLEQLDVEKTLFETIAHESGSGERTFIQNVLGAFLFSGPDVDKKVKVLSGGETSRLVLAGIMARPGNVLVLDEPTNHLDVESVEVLTAALATYAGTAVFVSHNEYFISRIANRIVEMRPGVFKDFPGSIADYRSFLEAGYSQSDEPAPSSKKEISAAEQDKKERIRRKEERKQTQRRIEKLEKDIEKMEAEMKAADDILNNPVNASNYGLLHDTAMAFEDLKKKNEKLVVEWETLQVKLAEYEEN
ncbi:MAG TPA: ABC-F family ATP-binding cassette domain-containing protein [Chitinivibrionales bacterium]|nr:ABC-F family ATP-binding cassette domain-containing protein [Chitinivibrionales bacterium]